MFELKKTMEISAAHQLSLSYPSKCRELHGHNWRIVVHCRTGLLNDEGMIFDFVKIKEVVMKLDHENLNRFMDQPTAENMAEWIGKQIPCCCRVDVQESEGNAVSWINDGMNRRGGFYYEVEEEVYGE